MHSPDDVFCPSRKGLPGISYVMLEDMRPVWVGVDNTMSIYKNGKFRRIGQTDGRPIGLALG